MLSIQTSELSKRFNREWVFRNLNYTFSQGKTYAITGSNGSGKSTLLQILWGQMQPTSGKMNYYLDDKIIEPEKIYQHISIATPYMDLVDEFTLEEQIKFHFKTKSILPGHSMNQVIEAMYLEPARNKFISEFSSGMRQRLKLGLAFYTQSGVIFLDEPGTNLDKQAFGWYQEQLEKVKSDRLMFIASNQPEEYPKSAIQINIEDFKG